MKIRLDHLLVKRKLVATRSQAESYIRLGNVQVEGRDVKKPGTFVSSDAKIKLNVDDQYVSRAGLKLASVATTFGLNFSDKMVLDVGSSTGGFTDYALKHGAKKVIAVDVGTNQLHPSLRTDPRIELHEQTDIRDFKIGDSKVGIVLIDVSFISIRQILPHVSKLITANSRVVAMVKPQFEATASNLKHKGVIKNEAMRRDILREFEAWAKKYFRVIAKADSQVSGEKGNKERFYLLSLLSGH